MRYIDYGIKYLIRRLIRTILKPKILISVFIIFIIAFFVFKIDSNAYSGNDEYTDRYNTLFQTYDTLANDLIVRMSMSTSSNLSIFKSYLTNASFNYYIYYGDVNGSSMLDGYTLDTSIMYIAFVPSSDLNISPAPNYDTWQGLNVNIRQLMPSYLFAFDKNSLAYFENPSDVTKTLYVCSDLLTYKPQNLVNFLTNNSQIQSDSIVGAIQEQTQATQQQTEKIEQQTQVQQQTQDFLKDDTLDNNSMTIDTSSFGSIEQSSHQQSVDNFFTGLLDTVYQAFTGINSTVDKITIPLPHTEQTIVLYSDIISKHISNTPIFSLIQMFWTFLFGSYIIVFVKRMLDWLSTGKLAEKGVFGFIEWLDIHNEIIKSYMM